MIANNTVFILHFTFCFIPFPPSLRKYGHIQRNLRNIRCLRLHRYNPASCHNFRIRNFRNNVFHTFPCTSHIFITLFIFSEFLETAICLVINSKSGFPVKFSSQLLFYFQQVYRYTCVFV